MTRLTVVRCDRCNSIVRPSQSSVLRMKVSIEVYIESTKTARTKKLDFCCSHCALAFMKSYTLNTIENCRAKQRIEHTNSRAARALEDMKSC